MAGLRYRAAAELVGSGLDPDSLLNMALDDGIPVVWVPSSGLLSALLPLSSTDRLSLLAANADEVVQNAADTLSQCDHDWLSSDRELCTSAVKAFQDGHYQAAMALAVSLGEPLAKWASQPRIQGFDSRKAKEDWERNRPRSSYKLAEYQLATTLSGVSNYQLKQKALMAPIPRFFAEWWPEEGTTPPAGLSRHVVAHAPTVSHFTRSNAVLALLLITSILREQQELGY